jgi:hypothetical protein
MYPEHYRLVGQVFEKPEALISISEDFPSSTPHAKPFDAPSV